MKLSPPTTAGAPARRRGGRRRADVILPAGTYARRADAATGRNVVVPGTYAGTEPAPVGPMAALLAVPRGIVAGADVVLTVLFVGGAFALLDATGALARLVGALVGRTQPDHHCVVAVSQFCDAGRAREHAGKDHRPHPRAPGAQPRPGVRVDNCPRHERRRRRRRFGLWPDEPVPDRHRPALRRDAAAQPAGAACWLARGRRGGVDRMDGRHDRTRR